jgi:tetratricopeptide (TPR) repeat protein
MMEFLIADEVLQSTNKEVFQRSEFQQLYPGKISSLDLTVSVKSQDVGYNIQLTVNRADQSASLDTVFSIHDRSALLTEIIPEIRKRLILTHILGNWKPSYLTTNWDAFVRFYSGLREWTRLEITKAPENFMAAIAIDPQFVLAKLRLAEVYTFGESRVLADSLLQSVRPVIGLLSRVDSLRAEAVGARIVRDFRKEVAIRRDIYQMYPLRKESAFDVAEAYFWLCEIPDAISYYRIAIGLDSNFARAYNHLGYCYSHLGDHDSALIVIRKYILLDSTANAYDSMGDCFMAAGYEDSAMWAKSCGIAIDPELWYLYWTSAFVRLRQGRLGDADSVATKYMQYVYTPDLIARGYTNKAFIAYERKDYRVAMKYCTKALQIFDSPDLGTRNPELHWLHTLVGLELNDMNVVTREMNQMEQIIRDNNINATNYQMYFYKYYRNLQACIAARSNDIARVIEVAKELDGPLRLKVRDHTSPFDYAFLNTSLGDLFERPPLSRIDFAIERYKCALQYNSLYAPAHYKLWKIYKQKGEVDKAEKELRMVKQLWKDADKEFKNIYGI